MRITVVVCTWNRADMLRGALASLEAVRAPVETTWDVLVVDNGSPDETAAVVAGFRDRLPVSRIEEGKPGLSTARNRAVSTLASDYVLWLDDDVEVEPGWLTAYVEAFRRWPEAAVFGGPIRPRLEGRPPAWLPTVMDKVAHAYAGLDLGAEPIPLGPSIDQLPYGANYAVRTREQRRHLYPIELGRRHGALGPGGEEIAVIKAILGDGGSGRWVPAAGVHHRIEPDRQTTAYLRRYAAADAIHDETSGWTRPASGPLTLPRLLIRATALELLYRARRRLSPPTIWVADLLAAGDAWGRVQARRARSRGSAP